MLIRLHTLVAVINTDANPFMGRYLSGPPVPRACFPKLWVTKQRLTFVVRGTKRTIEISWTRFQLPTPLLYPGDEVLPLSLAYWIHVVETWTHPNKNEFLSHLFALLFKGRGAETPMYLTPSGKAPLVLHCRWRLRSTISPLGFLGPGQGYLARQLPSHPCPRYHSSYTTVCSSSSTNALPIPRCPVSAGHQVSSTQKLLHLDNLQRMHHVLLLWLSLFAPFGK